MCTIENIFEKKNSFEFGLIFHWAMWQIKELGKHTKSDRKITTLQDEQFKSFHIIHEVSQKFLISCFMF